MKQFDNQFGETSSPDTKDLTAALAKAQSEFPSIELDAQNPHLRNRYATFQQCSAQLRGPLTRNGFSLPQYSTCHHATLGWVCVGVLRHASGQYVTGCVPLLMSPVTRVNKSTGELVTEPPTMQTFGACLTYAKRQLLLSLTGAWVGETDDDGESERQTAQAVAAALTDVQKKQAASDRLESLAVAQARSARTDEQRKALADRAREHCEAGRLTNAALERIVALCTPAEVTT